jgi:lysophospholipase L1-like esterase
MQRDDTARRVRTLALLLVVLGLVLTGCSPEDSGGEHEAAAAPSLAPSAPPRDLQYAALGDSFSSAPLVPVTDVANGCFRSSSNYPSLVARELGAELDDRSCGGAETMHFRRSQFADVEPQATALTKSTDLVTVGIGGNDAEVFSELVSACPRLRERDPDGSPCQQEMGSGGSDRLLAALQQTRAKVTDLVADVRRRAPRAKVLVVGYPRIVDPRNACDELPLALGDYAYAERVNRALTEALRSAAKATGTTYVDVWTASQGHDICSDDPWVNGAVSDRKRAAAYHPFAEEQAEVAKLVVAAARG